jgi:hypothetical protein
MAQKNIFLKRGEKGMELGNYRIVGDRGVEFVYDRLKDAKGFYKGVEWGSPIVKGLMVEELLGGFLYARMKYLEAQETIQDLEKQLEDLQG